MRVGLIVPRFKQSAVARNRLKRRLRELTRVRLLPAKLAADIVVRIRPDAYSATFQILATEIDRALVQLMQWSMLAERGRLPTSSPTPDA
jgi:ribonuclease P protein component